MKTNSLLLVVIFLAFMADTKAAVKQIRWGSSGDPLNGLTITWSNTGSADSIRWGYTASYEKGGFIGVKRTGYTSGTSFFKYVFPSPATPNSTIYYKIYDSATSTWTAQKTFATAPPSNATKFSFCALGDSRSNVSTVWKNVSNLANAKKSALTVFNGDVTNSGGSASEYDAWFTHGAAYLENNVVYHSLGNHDVAGAAYYQNIFELPKTNGSNLYYAAKYGNAIFITLNSENPSNAAQLTWLQTTLAAADADPTITWKIISFHKPLFNIGDHAGEMNSYRSTWWKAFDDYGVDLLLNGHDHNYQRSKPINLKVSTSAPVAKYGSAPGEGRCQIICGGAGATLYGKGSTSDAWAMNTFNETYNYVYFDVQDCKMVITAYNSSGSVLETLTLDKSTSPECLGTGIPETPEKFNPISIMPNPSEGSFTLLYSSELKGGGLVKIYDMVGKEIFSEKINKYAKDMEFKFDLSKYPKGIYTVSVIMGEQRDNAMLILNK